jgi:hypothetical protein
MSDERGMQRGDYLWSAGVLLTVSTTAALHITWGGDPANSLHMKALDGWLSLCWAAAALAGGGIVSGIASVFKKS